MCLSQLLSKEYHYGFQNSNHTNTNSDKRNETAVILTDISTYIGYHTDTYTDTQLI